MKRKLVAVLVIAAAAAAWPQGAEACTGITLKAKDGAYVGSEMCIRDRPRTVRTLWHAR